MDLSIIEQFEAQTLELTGEALKYHKLANAIREGSKLRPQCRNGYYYSDQGGSCALGAAFEGTFGFCGFEILQSLHAQGLIPEDLPHHKIFTYNDLGWTREAIADRLDDVAYGRREEF